MVKKKLNIICDTREQQPFTWLEYQDDVEVQVDTLKGGDYTLVGHDMPGDDHSIMIERKKSCSELLGDIGAGWETFKKKLVIMAAYTHKFIIVTESDKFYYLFDKGYTKMHPNFIYKRLAEITINYSIPILFYSSIQDSENFIFRSFVEIARSIELDG